jgi:outer membrane protein assembly factor BamA
MILRTEPSWFCGSFRVLRKSGVQAAAFLIIALSGGVPGCPQNGWTQNAWNQPSAPLPDNPGAPLNQSPAEQPPSEPENGTLDHWVGLPVLHISFEGVDPSRLDPLPGHLAQAEGAPLNPEDVRKSLRQLFATGLFETIEAEGVARPDGVSLIFRGTPRTFIGTVSVDGAKGATMNTQLSRATQLAAGHRFTSTKLTQALAEMRSTLADNGFHEPQITQNLTPHPEDQLIDIAFHVISGPQARIGNVQVTGDPGMSAEEFRRYAHLRTGARIDHDTPNRALSGVLKHYRSQERLEAEIKLESAAYDPATKRTSFRFSATQGPTVKVKVQGVNLSQERIRHVIPIYEEGTVDEDLLLEGNRRLRDLYQRMGYFDVLRCQGRSPAAIQRHWPNFKHRSGRDCL